MGEGGPDAFSGGAEPGAGGSAQRAVLDLFRTLVDTDDADVVARATCEGPLAALEPLGCRILLVDGPSLALLTSEPVGWGFGSTGRIPVDARLPVTEVLASGRLYAGSGPQLEEDYPLLRRDGGPPAPAQIAVPMRRHGEVIGVACWEFARLPDLSWDLHATLEAVAAALSMWCLLLRCRSAAGPGPVAASPPVFTRRQQRIITLARLGMTNAEIAAQLGFSEQTIKADLTRMYRLLGAHNRADLLARASEVGL